MAIYDTMMGASSSASDGWGKLGAAIGAAMSGGADRTQSDAYQRTLLRGHQVQKALMEAQKASAEFESIGQMQDAIDQMPVPEGSEWMRALARGAVVGGGPGGAQALERAQGVDFLRRAQEAFAAGDTATGQQMLALHNGKPMTLTRVQGNTVIDPTRRPEDQTPTVSPYGDAMLGSLERREATRQAGAAARQTERLDRKAADGAPIQDRREYDRLLTQAANQFLGEARQKGLDTGGLTVAQAKALLERDGELKALDGRVIGRWKVDGPSPAAAMEGSVQDAAAPGAPVTAPRGAPNPSAPVMALDSTLPASAAARLREGVVTQFANGQRWTLRQGMPVRVN